MENEMYQNKNTGEIWKLDHVENIPNDPNPIVVYVFENGERWCSEEFSKYFVKVEESK